MIIISGGNNPYENLSIEEVLVSACKEGGSLREEVLRAPIMYLWVNGPSVIVGRNQNIWRECRLDVMKQDGVLPVRRDTGGGAVFHDLGNLLFSFVMPSDTGMDFSYGLCIDALDSLGIKAERQGRNDIIANGRKFSGSAYMNTGDVTLHHGTMLIDSDLGRLAKYLAPSKTKLQAKGISSTVARVINLREMRDDITVEMVIEALIKRHGGDIKNADDVIDMDAVREKTARRMDWDFLYGSTPPFDVQLETRLSYGEVQLHLSLQKGVVSAAKVYTDALDFSIAAKIEAALLGVPMDGQRLKEALAAVDGEAASWLGEVAI